MVATSKPGGEQEGAPAALPPDDVRDLARRITDVGQEMLAALDRAGVTRSVRATPGCSLHLLSRSLPHQSLDDLLTKCEAFAFVTVPSALSRNDRSVIAREAAAFLDTFDTLLHVVVKQRRSSKPSGVTSSMRAPMLRMALDQDDVLDAIERLADLFAELSTADGLVQRKRHGVLSNTARVGRRFLVPGAVILVTIVLVGYLVSAAGHTRGGLIGMPLLGRSSTPTVASPTQAPGQADTTQTGATKTPNLPATPTPKATAASAPVLSVSQLNQSPCPIGTTTSFVITYTRGQGQVTWSATVDNSGEVVVSKDSSTFNNRVTGALQPGQQATVYVRAIADTSGQIQVQASNGTTTSVSYDTTSC